MPESRPLILGEFCRGVDERFRLSVPPELLTPLLGDDPDGVLVKERPGSLSLWSPAKWRERLDGAVGVVKSKWQAGRLDGRMQDVQRLGRMLSTRHRDVQIAGRGRLVIPEGFREFLGVEAGEEVTLVGAAVCVEIWHPQRWIEHLNETIPEFGDLLDELSS
jgi:MraZ protein